ncbi:MAG: hypothetical protein B7Z80_05730 [Rhodospirillales bacterium 20-64-7]|nr:MAG: hypothetical protein B7Z80_05730 [Rhodospirillales bacterium 20-64-7]HQT75643.1 ATP-binding protein [Rhodopila sp.]
MRLLPTVTIDGDRNATMMSGGYEPMTVERADEFAARVQRHAIRVTRRIVLTAVLLVAGMSLFTGWFLWSDYEEALRTARLAGDTTSAALAAELTRSIHAADVALQAVSGAIPIPAAGPERDLLAARIRIALLAAGDPDAGLYVVGADGGTLLSLGAAPPDPATVRRQTHFAIHRVNPNAGLIVDPPILDATDQVMTISQRLQAPDGRFAGEAVLRLNPAKLLHVGPDIAIGRRGLVFIAGTDGIIRASFARNDPAGTARAAHADFPSTTALPPVSTNGFTRRDGFDNAERLVSVRPLDHLPLVLLVAQDVSATLRHEHARMWLIGVVRIFAACVISLLAWLLAREIWRRSAHEIALAHDRDNLRQMQARIDADRARLDAFDRALQVSQRDLEAANHVRSQFMANMSHELRTPLHAIIGFSELIMGQAPHLPGGTLIGSHAHDILTSGQHLLALINTVLDIAKVESGTAVLLEEPLPISDLMRDSLVAVRGQAAMRGVVLETSSAAPALEVLGDRTRLLQVLINLLSNAVKFTPRGGTIAFDVDTTAQGEVVFTITDTGVGMTGPEIDIALQPFGQVDNAANRSAEGTGLGLPLARRLTELHGGRLEIRSSKGAGTRVTVTLPADRLRWHGRPRTGLVSGSVA